VLENITKDQPAFYEELFGPVFSMFRFHDDMEAIELANCTNYGLSGSIFTQDNALAKRKALMLEVGNVFINEIVASDPAIPCGGVKDSGFGRECFKDGLHETMNRKAIVFGK
jgi:succinate-semialdehyde dehydrogenase/glutarate-semialdehyde dehydrogenase